MTIGQSIRLVRKTRVKENQKDFARNVGVGQAYLSQIENDRKTPSIQLLKAISKHVDIPLPILFWNGLEETDIHTDKIEAFRIIKPTIDAMINSII